MPVKKKRYGGLIIFLGILVLIVGLVMSFWPVKGVESAPVQADAVFGVVFYDANQSGSYELGEKGISSATVWLLDAVENLVDSAVTGEDGVYAFTSWSSLPDGTYYVVLLQNAYLGALLTTPRSVEITKEGDVSPDYEINFGLWRHQFYLPVIIR